MLIKAEEMKSNAIDEALQLLENSSYLSESESRYYPELVPVRENARLGKNVVRLEDLLEYSMANGISDGGYALKQICEASDIQPSSVVFSVDEVHVLEDVNMEDTVRGLIEAGATVYAVPVSENDMASIMAETVTDYMVMGESAGDTAGTDALLEAFVNDDFETFFNEAEVTAAIQKKASKAGKKAEEIGNRIANVMKQAGSKSANWISKKISAFRSLADKLASRIKGEPTYKKVFNKVIAKIKQAIEFLSKQLKKASKNIQAKFA
jgi:hypothetical protein